MRAQHGSVHAELGLALMDFQQPFDFSARMRLLPKRLLPGFGIRLGSPMKKGGANTGRQQTVNRRVIVCGGRVVVAPVGQCGGAAVELVQAANQCRNVQVLRFKHRCQAGMHFLKILQQRPVGSQPAQGRLPSVHVGVDEPRDDDETCGVHHLRLVCVNHRRYRRERLIGYENVALRQVPQCIHRDDACAFDQCARHAHVPKMDVESSRSAIPKATKLAAIF